MQTSVILYVMTELNFVYSHQCFLKGWHNCSPELTDEELFKIHETANDLKNPNHLIKKSFKIARYAFYN